MSGDSPTRTPTPRPRRSPGRSERAEAAAAIRAEQRRRWRAGDRVPLESLLSNRPDLAGDPSLLIDLVYSEFVLAREVGAPASPAAYADRFPAIAAELADQLELECALMPAAGITATADAQVGSSAAGSFPRLPGYEIDGELGRGGMGVVYKARQVRLNRVVAVKTLPDRGDPDAADAVRFLAEAELVAAVKHPHVVSVFEFGHADGRPYFAMEYLSGGSLRDRLKAGGSVAAREAAILLARVARGVQAAHDQQVVHRDLKPANVLFDADDHPKVTDFGLARRGAGAGLTATQVVIGTPAYMAPEQAEGKGKFVGPAADVWSLGAILYECVTGSVPFPGDDPMTVLRQVLQDDPASLRSRNPAVPRDLDLVCLKCLRKNPADRYPTAGALADDLDRFAAGRPVSVRASGMVERAARWARRNPRDAALIGTVAVLLLTLAVGGSAAAVWMRHERDVADANSLRAGIAEDREKQRADELTAAETNLRKGLIESNRAIPGQVRGMRLRGEPGQFFRGRKLLRDALAQARDLGAPDDNIAAIRNEMMNLFTVTDVDVEDQWEESPPNLVGLAFTPELDRYLRVTRDEPPTVREAPGGRVLVRFPADVKPPQRFALSAGGRYALLGYTDSPRVALWEITGDTARRRWTVGGATQEAFLGDGSRVAVARVINGRPGIWILATATRDELRSFPETGWVDQVPAHRIEPWLVVDRGRHLEVVDYASGATVARVDRPTKLFRVLWHPTRPVLAIADGTTIRVRDVRTNRDVFPPLTGHTHDGVIAGFDSTGSVLVSSDWSTVVRCWDAATGRPVATGTRIIQSWDFAAAPPGRLAAGRDDRQAQVYRIHPGVGLRTVARANPVTDGFNGTACLSPDGRLLAARVGNRVEDTRCVLLDPVTGAELAALPDSWQPIRFTADGALLTSGPEWVLRWPVRHFGGRCQIGPPSRLVESEWVAEWGASPDGRVLAEPRGNAGVWFHRPAGAKVVSTGPQSDVRSAAVSPSGRLVAGASFSDDNGGTVTVYEPGDPEPVKLQIPGGGRARFDPTGRRLAVARTNGVIRVYDTDTWAERWSRNGRGAAFDPTGNLLAIGEEHGLVSLWDAATGREVARLEVREQTRLFPECFSQDGGRLVATGWDDRQLYIWDLRRLRAELAAEDLDWKWPALLEATDQPPPDRVEVILGRDERLADEA